MQVRSALALTVLGVVTLLATRPWATSAYADAPSARRAVVLELFSSEGCSSCPPADAVLAELARDQPVAGAEVIALELHVDYWNYLGWTDPFSKPAFSARQEAYATTFGQRGVYTPELVVDGASSIVGSDRAGARDRIAAAALAQKANVRVVANGNTLSITASDLPEKGDDADLWVAITEEGLVTAVPRGENAGSRLAHGPVVRSLERVASWAAPARSLTKEVDLRLQADWKREHLHAVAFVQRRGSLRILGAATTPLP